MNLNSGMEETRKSMSCCDLKKRGLCFEDKVEQVDDDRKVDVEGQCNEVSFSSADFSILPSS